MGLGQTDKGIYLNIINGKFCRRVTEGTEGAITRTNKIGKVVHEKYYDNFTGMLSNIRITESKEYGKSWNFDFVDGNDVYHVQMSYSNSFATALLKMLPNIDLSKEFTLTPSVKEVNGKNQSSLFVTQDNVAIKHAYTKDVPNGMPDMEKIMVKGQETWDDTKRLEFLTEMVNRDILPKLNQRAIETTAVATEASEPVATIDSLDATESEEPPF